MEVLDCKERWQSLFETWPDAIKRHGILVAKSGETIQFVDFMVADGILLLDREGPDSLGMRRALVSYDQISIVKLSMAGELSRFRTMGFRSSI